MIFSGARAALFNPISNTFNSLSSWISGGITFMDRGKILGDNMDITLTLLLIAPNLLSHYTEGTDCKMWPPSPALREQVADGWNERDEWMLRVLAFSSVRVTVVWGMRGLHLHNCSCEMSESPRSRGLITLVSASRRAYLRVCFLACLPSDSWSHSLMLATPHSHALRILKQILSRMLTQAYFHLHRFMDVSNLCTSLHCIIYACIFILTRPFFHLCKHEATGYGLEARACSSPIKREHAPPAAICSRRISTGPLVSCAFPLHCYGLQKNVISISTLLYRARAFHGKRIKMYIKEENTKSIWKKTVWQVTWFV